MSAKSARTYLPAAGHDWFLPLYDPLTRLLGADRVRRALLEQAALRPNHRVLDIGCGTGTLAVAIKREHPSVAVIGLDPDPLALTRARRKAERAEVAVRFDQGSADRLPYADATFDRVFSSMMMHHLPPAKGDAALQEVRRVLRAGGRLELLDFVPRMSLVDRLARAGFVGAQERGVRRTLFGRVAFYQATAP